MLRNPARDRQNVVMAVPECGECDGGSATSRAEIRAVCALPSSRVVTGRLALATVVAFALSAGLSNAQARFEVVDRTALTGATGLRLITLRDNVLKTCYLVLVADAPDQADPAAPVALLDIPDAATARDRRLADLLHGFDHEVGAIPGTIIPNPMKYDWQAQTAQFEFALNVLAHEFARLEQQIERASAASRSGITAVPAPCTPPAPATSTDHLPEKRR